MDLFLQFFLNGIMVGGLYSLIAISMVLIYKATRILNLAVGEMVMLGGFFCLSFLGWFKFPIWLALPLALAGAVVLGFLIERLALRPLVGQPILAALMATIALSLIFRGFGMFVWGASTLPYPPGGISRSPVLVGQVVIPGVLLWTFVVSIVIFLALAFFLKKNRMGFFMRATAESHKIAQSIGVDVKRVFGTTWAIGALIAAVGGIFMGARMGVGVGDTPLILLKALPAVLFGGLESIPGALIGGIIVGIIENLTGGFIDPNFGEITPYIILLLILLFRPEGLFGLKRIERI
ncbi:MAG: branched-chain amino acid ABC transporter permease [Thermodesulfobacteriota bacterium]